MAEALSQIPGKGSGSGAHLRASSLPADAQGRVRFAHRTLSLHATLPEVPVWDKRKLGRACAEAVKFVRFLWKWMEKREEIHSLHRGKVSFACGKTKKRRTKMRRSDSQVTFRNLIPHAVHKSA